MELKTNKIFLLLIIIVILTGCGEPTSERGQTKLTANKIGAGGGTITSSPEGISCGNDCSEEFTKSIPVTLTAIPDSNSKFVGWTGDCIGTGPCAVTMNSNLTVIANFEANVLQFNLPPVLPAARLGIPYTFSFQNTNPQGGEPPYRFVQETGGGFPPFGLSIDLDGVLTGKPTAEGERSFGVCIVDMAGTEFCQQTSLTVEGSDLSGEWSGDYDLTNDISGFCPNLPTVTHEGTLTATLSFDRETITGTSTINGIKSIGYAEGGCRVAESLSFTGKVAGSIKGDSVKMTVNFGDPDLFLNEISLEGTLKDNTISGIISASEGSGSFSIKK